MIQDTESVDDTESKDTESVDDTETVVDSKSNHIILELGDIIQIYAETNSDLHENTYLIQYIDDKKIRLANVATYQLETLNLDESGFLMDESITKILLLNRSEEAGYSRQNGLIPKTWVDLHFGGEIPAIITGEITNLEEDMIEITTYPEGRVIYIDFEYRGIPEDLPIEDIVIRAKPASLDKIDSLTRITASTEDECILPVAEEAKIEYIETGESIITIPDMIKENENIREVLHDMYVDANELFDEPEEEIILNVEVPERQKRYTIDAQTNDMIDELLSTIPNNKRAKHVLDNIHQLIVRFTELRNKFSKFDENGNIIDINVKGSLHKPLIDRVKNLNTKLQWLIPVISNKKKMYDNNYAISDNQEDFENVELKEDLQEQYDILQQYYDNKSQGDVSKYDTAYKRVSEYMRPFIEEPKNKKWLVSNKQIGEDLDLVVSNFADFYSSARKVVRIDTFHYGANDVKTRFIIQRYNLDVSKLNSREMQRGKRVYMKQPLMPADKVNIKSIVMLPLSIVKLSQVNLPRTNIMTKSHFSQYYLQLFRVLKKNIEVDNHIVEDLNEEVKYVHDDENTNRKASSVDFLSKITEFSLDEDLIDEDNKFERFLNSIVPKTRVLIRMIKDSIKDKLSFIDVVNALEPFMIYAEDVTYQQYNEIRYFIKEEIKRYKTSMITKRQSYDKLKGLNMYASRIVNRISKMFEDKKDYMELLHESYKIDKDHIENWSTSETILKLFELDQGSSLFNILNRMLLTLITPNKILDGLNKPFVDDMSKLEKIKPTDCARRFLTKKYMSIGELQKDNNVEHIYYDKEYDDTPYHILKKYEDKQKKMVPEEFLDYLSENLIQKHDCPPNMAREMATTLIEGKKRVNDREYAVLELRPKLPSEIDKSKLSEKELEEIEHEANMRVKIHYYRRIKDNWIRDEHVDENSFLDTQSLFCNVDESCYKNNTNNQCQTIPDTAIRMKKLSNERAMNEIDKRFTITVEELEKNIEKAIVKDRKKIANSIRLRDVQLYKANYLAYELGKRGEMTDLIVSPYAKLLDLILGQVDFIKKQSDICRFDEEYCREPMVAELKEHKYWAYCKETNTKLLPYSVLELARAFVYNDDYGKKQDELCRTHGILSDDGDSIVDKYSGYVICKLDFIGEDGYDESKLKLISHDILMKDIGNENEKYKRVFDNETDQYVYNIFVAILTNIGIPTENMEDYILRVSLELIRDAKIINTEEKYNKKAAELLEKKGKSVVPYPIYKNQSIITIVSAVIHIAIQSSIPSIKVRKTFPGCVRNFSGYPLAGGIEDIEGVKYIACVVDKIKTKEKPWDSIMKLNASILASRIIDVLDKYLVNRSDVNDVYIKKREYLLLTPDEIIPEEHSIDKWTRFLPPVVDFTVIKSLHPISSDFKKHLLELMRTGDRTQRDQYSVIRSKTISYTYGIIESINQIVKSKELLLKTISKKPFLENACCNEPNQSSHPMTYFIQDNPAIQNYNVVVNSLSKLSKEVSELAKAALFYHPAFTGIIYPPMPTGHIETTIYKAFIHYCNYDRNLPIPDSLKNICDEKPANYNNKWSIEEKMEFLKKHGKRYDSDKLYQLMNVIENRNRINLVEDQKYSPIETLKGFIEKMDENNSTIIEEPLRKLMNEVLSKYSAKNMIKENTSTEITKLRKYLLKTNKEMLKRIMEFFKKYGNKLSKTEYNHINTFMTDIYEWKLDHDMVDTGNYYDSGLYTVTQFIKNTITSMSKVYPNIILNNVTPKKIDKIWGKHLGLSDKHMKDITRFIEIHHLEFDKYKNDRTINQLLVEVQNRLIDLNMFLQMIPIETTVIKNKEKYYSLFDKKTTYLLYSYCFYSVLHEYIQFANDDDLIDSDIQEIKRDKREDMRESRVESSQIMRTMDVPQNYEDQFEMSEVQINAGDREEFKKRVCSLLVVFININKQNKETLNMDYNDISKRVRRSKQEEKKLITDYLENMEKDERKTEDMLKSLKLGRWNVGIQKGIFMYDKETYDAEREAGLARLNQDLYSGSNTVEFDETAVEVEDLEREDLENIDNFYEEEANDIAQFGDDYMDGNYYGEDRDEFDE
jgi:hypothetical protein